MPIKKMSSSEAIFGFCGWLTGRPEKTVMSSTSDCSVIVDLIGKFLKANNLPEPRNGWTTALTHPKEKTVLKKKPCKSHPKGILIGSVIGL